MINPNVLVVSDSHETARVQAGMLALHRIQCGIADASVQKLRDNFDGLYQLAIVDSDDPATDIIAICKQLRPRLSAPMLLLTYEHDERYHLKAYQVGVDECIPKPIGA